MVLGTGAPSFWGRKKEVEETKDLQTGLFPGLDTMW